MCHALSVFITMNSLLQSPPLCCYLSYLLRDRWTTSSGFSELCAGSTCCPVCGGVRVGVCVSVCVCVGVCVCVSGIYVGGLYVCVCVCVCVVCVSVQSVCMCVCGVCIWALCR